MDPRNPASNRMVAEVQGGGWAFLDFAPDKSWGLVGKYTSVQKSDFFRLDLATGAMTPIGDHSRTVSHGGGQFAPDGTHLDHQRRRIGVRTARYPRSRHGQIHRARPR